ncbi:transcription factor of the MADS box family [Scheffersomyces stipitis CBS 6054]|uniref:Transcription factor of the MADS box family n=1 Tax=Scheffersomyces stipitis (strain ATCC 58785 / CBS 6054 / NBRC 10063 / NRRL Y-11545) TaxID=322104 RepID=A3GGD2_PICST|nr:transcription factor of the MADS box family [Scheffersomyces stipitis CBS 6054]EAZ63499.2 transcription factor of the MADS box family [Scheffersomyces stipitis CBS 6054]
MGRRKIEIQPLTDDRNRTVTFVKRKAGLFKKAHELAVLCQVDLAVIIVGSNNKIYEFSSVDTGELIKSYQHTCKTKQPQESKSPENYGNYRKKKFLNESLSRKSGASVLEEVDHDMDENEVDSEYDSDSPEPKRHKRSYSDYSKNTNSKVFNSNRPPPPPPPHHISLSNMPTFNNPTTFRMKEDDINTPGSTASNATDKVSHKRDDSTSSNQRPVLRVQIPTDAKSNSSNNKSSINDSARTITAIDTNMQNTSNNLNINNNHINQNHNQNHTNNSNLPNINTPKYSSFASFRSPDSRKPTLPLPIQSKSQTSSPASATAPPLPIVNNGANMAINSNVANPNAMYYSSIPQGSPSNPYPNGILPTPILNQVFNQQYGQQLANGNDPHSGNAKFRPPIFTNLPNNVGEQTPISGLPSRYVNDMFPSPSNFYAPQDWPSGNTGMTPIHANIPQYFMNMLPSAGPSSAFPGNPGTKLPANVQQQQTSPAPATVPPKDGPLSPTIFMGTNAKIKLEEKKDSK